MFTERCGSTSTGPARPFSPWLFVWIAGHDDLPEVIADVTEREGLLFALFVVGDVPFRHPLDGAALKIVYYTSFRLVRA